MKRSLLFLVAALIFFSCSVFVESSDWGWKGKQFFIPWLVSKTGRHFPEVVAVVLPIDDKKTDSSSTSVSSSVLGLVKTDAEQQYKSSMAITEDVALALRALLKFQPESILIQVPLADLTTGPFSLLREAQSEGKVQQIPVSFQTFSTTPLKKKCFSLFKNQPTVRTIPLEDLLLRCEETERGSIKPDLELLFRNKIVLLAGVEGPSQAAQIQDELQKKALRHLTPFMKSFFILAVALVSFILLKFSEIDFLLLLFLMFILYSIGIFLTFQFFGILLPIFSPVIFILLLSWKKKSYPFL